MWTDKHTYDTENIICLQERQVLNVGKMIWCMGWVNFMYFYKLKRDKDTKQD